MSIFHSKIHREQCKFHNHSPWAFLTEYTQQVCCRYPLRSWNCHQKVLVSQLPSPHCQQVLPPHTLPPSASPVCEPRSHLHHQEVTGQRGLSVTQHGRCWLEYLQCSKSGLHLHTHHLVPTDMINLQYCNDFVKDKVL